MPISSCIPPPHPPLLQSQQFFGGLKDFNSYYLIGIRLETSEPFFVVFSFFVFLCFCHCVFCLSLSQFIFSSSHFILIHWMSSQFFQSHFALFLALQSYKCWIGLGWSSLVISLLRPPSVLTISISSGKTTSARPSLSTNCSWE